MQNLSLILKNMSTRARVTAGVGLVAALVVFVLLARLATTPSYETLMTGVDPAEAGKVTRALDEQGIQYQLENGGTAVAVQPAQAAQARIALAEQGLGGGGTSGKPGFELFDACAQRRDLGRKILGLSRSGRRDAAKRDAREQSRGQASGGHCEGPPVPLSLGAVLKHVRDGAAKAKLQLYDGRSVCGPSGARQSSSM